VKGVAVLGSTGTIGVNTLDVLSRHPDRFRVVALTANTDDAQLAEQCERWRPAFAVMADAAAARRLARRLAVSAPEVSVLSGVAGLEEVAGLPEVACVMAAIVGAAGLLPTLAAARAGKRVLLANKEALVMSGRLLLDTVRRHGAEILPIDSEHNAIFQCMPPDFGRGLDSVGVRRILLTASGGPFRTRSAADLEGVTPEEACAHPNWVMGRKISVDSATMMNKGLEVVEACWLFDTTPARVEVVVHPQSVIHSMVEYHDGSVLAQLGNPDMRTPIAHALAWPERVESGVTSLDLVAVGRLDFERPDPERFPCLRLACEAARAGGTAPAILNAANEVAVDAFLERRLRFTDIPRVIDGALSALAPRPADDLEVILEDDQRAREVGRGLVRRFEPVRA
jgi:1-deoxy-D-xylulose-5-phosphate reductoisomerase